MAVSKMEDLITQNNRDFSKNTPVIRTYQSDLNDYIKNENVSVANIAAQEIESHEMEPAAGAESSERTVNFVINKKLVIILIALVVLGGGGFWIYFKGMPPLSAIMVKLKGNRSEINGQKTQYYQHSPIISLKTDAISEIYFRTTQRQIFSDKLKEALNIQDDGNLVYLPTTLETMGRKEMIKAVEFLSLMDATPPAELAGYLDDDFSLFKLKNGENSDFSPVLIFKAKVYDYAFSGMLKWEKDIDSALKSIFKRLSVTSNEGIFVDKYIQNHDTRVLYGEDGRSVLAYSFLDRKYLIIVENEEDLKEIFKRFSR